MEKFQPNWIQSPDLHEDAISHAETLGKKLAPESDRDGDAMTTSQLRRFFGALKKVQIDARVNKDNFKLIEVKLLKPKLAYAVGRATRNNRIKDFYNAVAVAIDAVSNRKDFLNMVDWVEAIVAYHKSNGGKDKTSN